MKNRTFLKVGLATLLVLLILCLAVILEYHGLIWHTSLFTLPYKVKGLDVSHHQGEIDWSMVPSQKYSFVFIKATEGDDFVDHEFKENWDGARSRGLLTGAYHFFLTSSSGEAQAENIIRTVPFEEDALPVVLDIEIRVEQDPQALSYQKEIVQESLQIMIDKLFEIYGKKPILYVTDDTYDAFVKGNFHDCEIWFRDIVKPPILGEGRKWFFWQYCNRGHVEGIDGYVDINVFAGTEEGLLDLVKSKWRF